MFFDVITIGELISSKFKHNLQKQIPFANNLYNFDITLWKRFYPGNVSDAIYLASEQSSKNFFIVHLS